MSSRVCVDASLAIEWLIPTQSDLLAESLLEMWDEAGFELIAPPLFDAEVISVIRQHVYFKRLLPEQGERAFSFYRELGVKIVSPAELSLVAWELAKEFNLPVCYDVQYLAVAELADCELWTLDRKLVKAVRGNKRVRWVGERTRKRRADRA